MRSMSEKKQNSRIWWYKGQKEDHSFVRGPFTWEEIIQRLEKEVISESTMVKRSADVYWQELSGCLHGKKRSWGLMIAGLVCVTVAFLSLFFYAATRRPNMIGPGPSCSRGCNRFREDRPGEAAARVCIIRVPCHGNKPGRGTTRSNSYRRNPLTKDAIIKLGNDTRASHGLTALAESQLLNKIAEERLHDMFQKQYIGHVSPAGEQASDHAQRVGYHYKIIAENIASGNFLNNQKVIDGWMQSPGHRQNILSTETKEIGVAIERGQYQGANMWIAVQIFGLQSPPLSTKKRCTPPSQDLYAELESGKTEMMNLDNRLARFKQDLDQEISAIEADRRYVGNNGQGAYNLNVRVNSYNEKVAWYNSSLADLMAKRAILKSMAEDYNRRVQAYHDCESSGN